MSNIISFENRKNNLIEERNQILGKYRDMGTENTTEVKTSEDVKKATEQMVDMLNDLDRLNHLDEKLHTGARKIDLSGEIVKGLSAYN